MTSLAKVKKKKKKKVEYPSKQNGLSKSFRKVCILLITNVGFFAAKVVFFNTNVVLVEGTFFNQKLYS